MDSQRVTAIRRWKAGVERQLLRTTAPYRHSGSLIPAGVRYARLPLSHPSSPWGVPSRQGRSPESEKRSALASSASVEA
jgi:hypothetical protein